MNQGDRDPFPERRIRAPGAAEQARAAFGGRLPLLLWVAPGGKPFAAASPAVIRPRQALTGLGAAVSANAENSSGTAACTSGVTTKRLLDFAL